MSFTYGFYNAVNHDRVYDARQLAAIFDGIINDGVYESQGERFFVSPASQGMGVTVAPGRAWFDHTWNYNDSLLPLNIAMSDVLLNRIDAIVLETNTSTSVRANSIKVITGIPAETPSKPSMTRSEYINQYPLAYVSVPANTSTVDAANIENAVGTSACPYVTGLLQVITIDNIVAQWQAQWNNYFRDLDSWTDDEKREFLAWIANQEAEFLAWKNGFKADTAVWRAEFEADAVAWRTRERARWEEWFRNIQYVLDGDAAGHLQNEIDNLDYNLHHDMNELDSDIRSAMNTLDTDLRSDVATQLAFAEKQMDGFENCETTYDSSDITTIIQTYSNRIKTTIFNEDGSITETLTHIGEEIPYATKTTTFNEDGSISETIDI